MGTAQSQHSASVRVSECGYPKQGVSAKINSATNYGEESIADDNHVSIGLDPHLASASIRSVYKQAEKNLNNRRSSRRKYFVPGAESDRLSANGGVYDCVPIDSSAWNRSSPQKKVRSQTLKQTSYNSTNSSYIADCSPGRSGKTPSNLNIFGQESSAALNESKLRLGLNRLSSIDTTFSNNGRANIFQSPSRCDLLSYEDRAPNIPELDQTTSRLVQRRHLSELCLHLDGLNNKINNNNHNLPPILRSQRRSHPPLAQYFVPTYNFGVQTYDVGPFIRMANTSASMYTSKSQVKSPSCQATPAQSVYHTSHLTEPHLSHSSLSSEAELLSPDNDEDDDALNNYNDYVNLPKSRSRSFKMKKNWQQQPCTGTKTKTIETSKDSGGVQLPNRSLSKSRWRFMSKGKKLTKSISCYAFKFFGQQNRSYEISDQLLVSTNQGSPTLPNRHLPLPPRPLTQAIIKRDRGDGHVVQRDNPNSVSDDLGQTFHRLLRLGHSKESESDPKRSHIASLHFKINRSLSACANQDLVSQQSNAVRRSTFKRLNKDGLKRDKLHNLQTTSTKELLHCLSIFILRNCDNLCASHAVNLPLNPGEIIAWIKDIDKALIQQGWTDVPFLCPANVVFLYIMIKGSVNSSITCSRELHSLVMVCLYLSYGYMGNEISYPLKPFLNAEILYSMMHENTHDSRTRFRNINTTDSMPSRNPKVINHFRDAFWETCLRVSKCKSKDMIQLNADAIFFTQSIAELRSYANSPVQKPISSA